MNRPGRIVLTCALAATTSVGAAAQRTGGAAPSPRLEVSAGGGWFTGSGLGDAPAALRNRDGDPYELFATDSRFDAGPALDIRATFHLTRRYGVEARFGFSHPELRTDISADVEGAPPLAVSERLDRYIADAAVVINLRDVQVRGWVPFLAAGAGYLRELHEGRTLVEQGIAWHGGGGVRHTLLARERRAIKSLGVRGDGRVYVLTGGAAGDGAHMSLTGGVFLGF